MHVNKLGKVFLNDPLVGTAPIFKLTPGGLFHLIGSGLWITCNGHLITAWHVIADNIGKDGVDEGPIVAIQTLPDRTLIVRSLKQSIRHKTFDLALSETAPESPAPPTIPHMMTLEGPAVGSHIHTHSFLDPHQTFSNEKVSGVSTFVYRGEGHIPEKDLHFDVGYMARVSVGKVVERFPAGRDSVMLPFPCFQSDMPLYGANSGGPVFDEKGRVCGINCTSYEGADISFHASLEGVLSLTARDIAFIPEDPVPRRRSVAEMGLAHRIPFDPPLIKIFVPLYIRVLLWPYHLWLDFYAALRWKLRPQMRKATEEVKTGKRKT